MKLDKKRTVRLARWTRRRKVAKRQVIRAMIDRAGPIESGEELIELVDSAKGKGLGLTQKRTASSSRMHRERAL